MKIMAVDVGTVRTGIAVCDKLEFLASPLCVITEKNFTKLPALVADVAIKEKAEQVIVGRPVRLNGVESKSTERSDEFIKELSKLLEVPVKPWDERVTTTQAQNQLQLLGASGKKQRQIIDAVAAVLILENYMAYRKNTCKE